MAPQTQPQQTTTFDAPPYDANWIVDEAHNPEASIDRHGRNAQSPAAHDVYRRAVSEKAEKFGVIHVDPATGYRARFKPQGGDPGKPRAETGGGGGRDQANGVADRTRGAGKRGAGQGGDDEAAKAARRIADLEQQLADARSGGGAGQ